MDLTQQQIISGEQLALENEFKQKFVDLAGVRVGGRTLSCSDDFFAPMSNLIQQGRGQFIPDKYTDRGKWMDGWESRRSYGRTPPRAHVKADGREFDWCIIRLGIPGIIQGLDIDTNYFRGNAPLTVSVEACHCDDDPDENTHWQQILIESPVKPHIQNLFKVENSQSFTHVRLNIYPDGGVARFRVYGLAHIEWSSISNQEVNLGAIELGARVIAVSDMFFSDKNNLILPGNAINMGDGWETRRRRDPGPDWAIVKLAHRGTLNKIILDTSHFKGNYPDRFSLEFCDCHDSKFQIDSVQWHQLLPQTRLSPDTEHVFEVQLNKMQHQAVTHVRLCIYPDGGVARLRLSGQAILDSGDACERG